MKPYRLHFSTPHLLGNTLALAVMGALLAGCAGFSKDGGLSDVQSLTQQHIKQDVAWPKTSAEQQLVEARVAELLQKALDVESAVQIALLNNKGLQASLFELGIPKPMWCRPGGCPTPSFPCCTPGTMVITK